MKQGILLLLLVWGVMLPLHAQKISVNEATREVESARRPGLATKIIMDKKTVEKAWYRKLKELGKVETVGEGYVLRQVFVNRFSDKPVNIYSRIETDQYGTEVFWAIDRGTEFVGPGTKGFQEAHSFLHDFAVNLYREDINKQIEEADRAVDQAVKIHDKRVEAGLTIQKNRDRNRLEISSLKKRIADLELQGQQLLTDSTQNRVDQATALEEIERLRKISEAKKAKLSQIE